MPHEARPDGRTVIYTPDEMLKRIINMSPRGAEIPNYRFHVGDPATTPKRVGVFLSPRENQQVVWVEFDVRNITPPGKVAVFEATLGIYSGHQQECTWRNEKGSAVLWEVFLNGVSGSQTWEWPDPNPPGQRERILRALDTYKIPVALPHGVTTVKVQATFPRLRYQDYPIRPDFGCCDGAVGDPTVAL